MTQINDIGLGPNWRHYAIKRAPRRPHFNYRHLKKAVKFQAATQYWTHNGQVHYVPGEIALSILFRNEQELIDAGYTLQGETS